MSATVVCPHCHKSITLDEALTHQVKAQFEEQFSKEKKNWEQEKNKLLADQKSQLDQEKKTLEITLKTKLDTEKKRLWEQAQQAAKEKQHKELLDLQTELQEKSKKLEDSEKQEIELRRQKRDLEERERRMELELARKLDLERVKLAEELGKQFQDEQRLKVQEKDKQLDIMRKQIDDLKRKAEQGSMQIQGEVQENDLRELLSSTFLMDEITDVPTGTKGADLVQKVNAKLGAPVATIIWESKNTKSFSEGWLTKLKGDQGLVKADVAILVSQSLPEDIKSFGVKNEVWIVSYAHAIALASALRLQLLELSKLKQSLVGRDEKMEMVYRYLSGPQFKNRVENIVMAFVSMKQDLEKERNAFARIWAKREKEIDRVVQSTSSMYGDLQGIIGGSLPGIDQLELKDGFDDLTELAKNGEQVSLLGE